MTEQTATSATPAGRQADVTDRVRLRHIAAQAEAFVAVLDELHNRLSMSVRTDQRVVTALVEQAAAAAADLALTATLTADKIVD